MKLYPVLLGLFISASTLTACDSDDTPDPTPTRPAEPAVRMLPAKMSYIVCDMAGGGPDRNVAIEYTYDGRNRLVRWTTRTETVSENTGKLTIVDISYDNDGRIVSQKVGGTGYEIETDCPEGLLSEYYTETFEYDGNVITVARPGTILRITTDKNGFAHRLEYEWDEENTGIIIHAEDYYYDKSGNIVRIEEHQNDYHPVYTYEYGNDIGAFRCVNMPQWYMMTYMRGYGAPIHIINNATKEYFHDDHRMDYSYEYNREGYPTQINGEINPDLDGAQGWRVAVKYQEAPPQIEPL